MEIQDIITAEQLRQDQQEVFEDVLTSDTPKVIIYAGEPALVLMNAATYRAQLTRLALLEKIMTGQKDIEAGRVVTNEQIITELQQRLSGTTEAQP
jgi:PHD/YefM family antitoxin component YafN of YafNO toxin-antitoxin module